MFVGNRRGPPSNGWRTRVLTLGAEEVVQHDTQDTGCQREKLARPAQLMEYVRQRVPVGEVGLGCDHRREEYDVRHSARHTIARKR